MNTSWILRAAWIASLLSSGCGAIAPGSTVVKFEKDEAPIKTEVATPGTYALYATTDMTPKVTRVLEKGDSIGFAKDPTTGQVTAIAGAVTPYPLSGSENYYWKQVSP